MWAENTVRFHNHYDYLLLHVLHVQRQIHIIGGEGGDVVGPGLYRLLDSWDCFHIAVDDEFVLAASDEDERQDVQRWFSRDFAEREEDDHCDSHRVQFQLLDKDCVYSGDLLDFI